MANEVINLNTVFSGFNSGTDLQPKNARTNNQGVKVTDIVGFTHIDAAAPATTSGVKGDLRVANADKKIYICFESFGTLPIGTVLAGTPSAVADAAIATYEDVPLSGGTGTGLTAKIIIADATTITSIEIDAAGTGYTTGDTLTVAAGKVGGESTSFTIALVAADTAAVWLKTAALS